MRLGFHLVPFPIFVFLLAAETSLMLGLIWHHLAAWAHQFFGIVCILQVSPGSLHAHACRGRAAMRGQEVTVMPVGGTVSSLETTARATCGLHADGVNKQSRGGWGLHKRRDC